MFQFDEQFLKDIGLDNLPEEQKKPFLQHIYDELELRVGTVLSEGLNDEQLKEFESIIDHKDEVVIAWLAQNAPDYKVHPAFIKLQEATKIDINDPSLRAEFAATKWLEMNRSDYREVVLGILEDIKKEIIANRDAILSEIKA